jgi:hypothetical protein
MPNFNRREEILYFSVPSFQQYGLKVVSKKGIKELGKICMSSVPST